MRESRAPQLLLAGLLLLPVALWSQERTFETDILTETFGFGEDTKRSVALEDLHQGCPARDCIPAIDAPQFVAAAEADFLADDDLVLTVVVGADVRAYPARILNFHEIVNDVIDGQPIAITYCPLCGSGVAFRRTLAGQVTEFGVSGVLYNSDLVLYDRVTGTLWDQIRGRGIVGPLTGTALEAVPLGMARWGQWRAAHPDTRVLSTTTGHDKDYDQDPYARYRASEGIMFPVGGSDDRIGPKTVVFGAYLDGTYIAWSERLLQAAGRVRDTIGGHELEAALHPDGTVSVRDLTADRELVPVRLFWFAWYAFHPATTLRDVSD